MESKQEQLLSRVVVDHLFLSQFEPFRALLLTLYDVNPVVALAILKSVIKGGGRVDGVLWSDSVPSPAHLSWLCLGELVALQADRAFSPWGESAPWISDPTLIFDHVEFLLLVDLLRTVSAAGSSTLTQESGIRLWESGKNEFRNFGNILSDRPSLRLSSTRQSRKASDSSTRHDERKSAKEASGAGRRAVAGESSRSIAREETGATEDGEGEGQAGPSGDSVKDGEDLRSAGAEFMEELAAAGSSRLQARLKRLEVVLPEGQDGVEEEESETYGSSRGEQSESHFSSPGTDPAFNVEDGKDGITVSDSHKIWIRRLALYHPDLLQAISTNVRRQLHVRQVVTRSTGNEPAVPPKRGSSFEADTAREAEARGESERAQSHSQTVVEENTFELGNVVLDEVQRAHLEQMREDISVGKVAQAIQHLCYLHGGTRIADSEYREVIRKIVEVSKRDVDARRSPRDRCHDSSIHKAYEQVIGSGSVLLASMTESIQDDLILEAAQEMKPAGDQALPPPLEKIHVRLEARRAAPLTTNVSADSVSIRSCRMEMFQFARVMQVHVLETVMKAAILSIKALQLQKAANVLVSYPSLQRLATVMGWDLLAGNTLARRQLMGILWAGRQKHARQDGGSAGGKPIEEVSCVDELCDQLCYHVELAYFAALVNTGENWQSASSRKTFGSSRQLPSGNQEYQPPAEAFVANLVLDRLSVHSPLRVIFDLVPNVKVQDVLLLLQRRPMGSTTSGLVGRAQDIELVHMNFGLQVAVAALGFLESGALEEKREIRQKRARSYLLELRRYLDAVTTPMRKIWMMTTIVHLLYMDDLSGPLEGRGNANDDDTSGGSSSTFTEGDKPTAIAFVVDMLLLLRHCLSSLGLVISDKGKQRQLPSGGLIIPNAPESVSKIWEQKASSIKEFVEDWEWRLEVLQRLRPSMQHQWQWKEALGVLRAAPSTLLNMCVQGAQYDLGEEAVRRYNLLPEEVASLQLAEWIDGATYRSLVDNSEEASASDEGLNLIDRAAALPHLASVVLFLDAAAASAKSVHKAKQLIERARVLLSQVSSAGSRRHSGTPIEQKQEAARVLVAKRLLQRFQDLLDQDKSRALQTTFSGADIVSSGIDVVHQGPKQRPLGILHQIIEDAHNGKRQFLSGKLHNLVKALSDEDDDNSSKQPSPYLDRKQTAAENGLVFGLGLQASAQASPLARVGSGDNGDAGPSDTKSSGKGFLGSLSHKPMAYLSAFMLYIATVGDIVDGADTTHDFNYFSVIYGQPNDLLTRLVFERGNADAAGKVAEIMGEDLVHQVITACVPPVYAPQDGKGWACIPRLPCCDVQSVGALQSSAGPAGALGDDKSKLYVLQQDVVKHLATLSPVRAVLACVFGSSRFTLHGGKGEADASTPSAQSQQRLDDDKWLYEFALEQSDRYPTLHRWIQIQANHQRLSDSPISTKRVQEDDSNMEIKRPRKRMRDPQEGEAEAEGNQEDEGKQENLQKQENQEGQGIAVAGVEGTQGSGQVPWKALHFKIPEESFPRTILLDWENEELYSEAVKGLMEEGKLVDALALADRCLRGGAPDTLLQLLIERGEDSGSHSGSQWQGHGSSYHGLSNSSWQYCIRLRDNKLAATLALRYFHRWELDAAIDVLTKCTCHLDPRDSLYEEVIRLKRSLQQYGQILRADSRLSNWREVEALCHSDPEGLAIRLASKGAVSTALGVAESFNLSNSTRRDLQGRQLVQLMTSEPTAGGGPTAALKFLKSLQNPADALPVAMAAMERLPNLRSKQLLVHFFLKGRVGSLGEEERARLDRLALGLRMLGALPLPWQQRCSGLHEHPRLILETLLMWKQLKAAAQLVQAFPSLRDNQLIISYAAKAITCSSGPVVERRTYTPSPTSKPPLQPKSHFAGITTLQREARRAFSWTTTSKDTNTKNTPKEAPTRKRKGSWIPPSQMAAWEAITGVPEERPAMGAVPPEEHERHPPVTTGDEWVLSGDSTKDDTVRSSHRYERTKSAILFKSLLSLCSEEAVAAKAAVNLCVGQIQKVLCSEQLPVDASPEVQLRAFQAAETFVQVLLHAATQLRKIVGQQQESAARSGTSEITDVASARRVETADEIPSSDELQDLLSQADVWLSRTELLRSLLGSGVRASLDDLLDEESAIKLRDRLIDDERYNIAGYTCTKCKIDALPVWEAWGHALVRIEHYAQARVKFKQAIGLLKSDPAPFVHAIIQTMESGPPVDITVVQNLYSHMATSFSASSDDSLSADSYLKFLYMPSFTKNDRSRRSSEDSDSFSINGLHQNGEDPIKSNLDGVRYEECVYYLQEYARQDLLTFAFRHGHYYDACEMFFPRDCVPPPPVPSPYQAPVVTSSPQRPDSLATDYGSIDDLCDYCVSYGAISVLERALSTRSNHDPVIAQHTAAALTRICTYCEAHRHFNHLYRFQVLKRDYIAAGLCCIQLFLNSSHQEEALRHLEHAKVHFEEGFDARQHLGDMTKGSAKPPRGKLPSDKVTDEELNNFSKRIKIQIDVVRAFSEADGPLWKRSLFGNPNDADTFKRRCDVAEALVEKHFDLAFKLITEFGLKYSAGQIYAGVAASLAERRRIRDILELLKNISNTIDDDDRDQVLGAAINVYAIKHRERQNRLIEMLSSSHRKVLACVSCGRLKSAYQTASKSGSVTDVQLVAEEAQEAGNKSVQDLCKQWLAKHS